MKSWRRLNFRESVLMELSDSDDECITEHLSKYDGLVESPDNEVFESRFEDVEISRIEQVYGEDINNISLRIRLHPGVRIKLSLNNWLEMLVYLLESELGPLNDIRDEIVRLDNHIREFPVYEDELEKLFSELRENVIKFNYFVAIPFADLLKRFFRLWDEMRDAKQQKNRRIDELVRTFDYLSMEINVEWGGIFAQQEEELEAKESKEKESEEKASEEDWNISHRRKKSRALNAENPSKLASKHHREEKRATLEAYQAAYPDESSPVYIKQLRFFKGGEPKSARCHAKRQLVAQEMDAMTDEFNEEFDEEETTITGQVQSPIMLNS